MRQWSEKLQKAVEEVGLAERSLRTCATALVVARNERDQVLAACAQQLQAQEVRRLARIAEVLSLLSDTERATLEQALHEHERTAQAVGRVDVGSDIRMFVHKSRVAQVLRDQRADLRDRRSAAAARRRRKQAREADEAMRMAVGVAGGGAGKGRVAEKGAESKASSGDIAGGGHSAATPAGGSAEPSAGAKTTAAPSKPGQPSQKEQAALRERRRKRKIAATAELAEYHRRRAMGKVFTPRLEHTGVSEQDEHGFEVVPQPASATARHLFSAGHLEDLRRLAQPVRRWVRGIMNGRGGEFRGVCGVRVYSDDHSAKLGGGDVSKESGAGDGASEGEGHAGSNIVAGLTADSCVDSDAILKLPAGRILFLRCLNAWRAHRKSIPSRFGRACRVMWWFLDWCKQTEDVAAAKMLMVLSETFWDAEAKATDASADSEIAAPGAGSAETGDAADEAISESAASDDAKGDADNSGDAEGSSPGIAADAQQLDSEGASPGSAGEKQALSMPTSGVLPLATGRSREYLQRRIQSHPIWQSTALWEEALYRSAREEVARVYDPSA